MKFISSAAAGKSTCARVDRRRIRAPPTFRSLKAWSHGYTSVPSGPRILDHLLRLVARIPGAPDAGRVDLAVLRGAHLLGKATTVGCTGDWPDRRTYRRSFLVFRWPTRRQKMAALLLPGHAWLSAMYVPHGTFFPGLRAGLVVIRKVSARLSHFCDAYGSRHSCFLSPLSSF